jgi:hypothetical protein
MMRMKIGVTVAGLLLAIAGPVSAAPITIMVGDNDGYGFGVPDNGTAIWAGTGVFGSGFDNRSTEVGIGGEITDVYSAFYNESVNGNGPGGPGDPYYLYTTADVIFPLAGLLSSASLTVDMGGFESNIYAEILAGINGVALPFHFHDGTNATAVRTFTLTPEQLAAANLAQQVVLHFDGSKSTDFVAFDYFQLDADVTPVPEPATLGLVGVGLAALARRRLKRRA